MADEMNFGSNGSIGSIDSIDPNDMGAAIDKLRQMMSSDDGRAKINNIISAFSGGTEEAKQVPPPENTESVARLAGLMSQMSKKSGAGKDNLIRAVAPYLKPERREKADGAVKIMGMLRAAAVLKESGFDLGL